MYIHLKQDSALFIAIPQGRRTPKQIDYPTCIRIWTHLGVEYTIFYKNRIGMKKIVFGFGCGLGFQIS